MKFGNKIFVFPQENFLLIFFVKKSIGFVVKMTFTDFVIPRRFDTPIRIRKSCL